MAIEPQPAPQQLVLPTFSVIGRPPVLLSRLSDDFSNKNHRTSSPEPMPLDMPTAHSPLGETSGTRGLWSRTSVPVSASSSTTSAPTQPSNHVAPPSLLTASSRTGASSPLSDPPSMTPVIAPARPASVSTTDAPAFSPISSGFEKGKEKATAGTSSIPVVVPAQPSSSSAGATSSTSHISGTPSAAPPTSDAVPFDFPSFEAFLNKRAQSLAGVHTQHASRAKQWVDQSQSTVASGVTLLKLLGTLKADADATVAQAAHAREEAARAEDMATTLRARVQEASELADGLQKSNIYTRDLADKVKQYSERLMNWDATTNEKERGFVGALREHRQAEETARSRRADEVARHEAERAEEEAVRAQREMARVQEEAARNAEREEVHALRTELEAAKRKELALTKKVDVLERAKKAFLESVEGLRAYSSNSGAIDDARMAIDQPVPVTPVSAQSAFSIPAIASTSTAAPLGGPGAFNLPLQQGTPSGSMSTAPLSASPASASISTLRPSATSSAGRQSKSPAQTTSRPLVNGFVPAQTAAGRAVDTQLPLSSTARATGQHVQQNGSGVQRPSPFAISPGGPSPVPSAGSAASVSTEVVVKREPEPDADLSQDKPPPLAHSANTSQYVPQAQRAVSSATTSATPSAADRPAQATSAASAPRPTSTTSDQTVQSSLTAAPAAEPALPPPARQPAPLREPSPMGPGFDGDDHLMMGPDSRDHDMDDRRSYDSHAEPHAKARSPVTQQRPIDLGLPPKPKFPPIPRLKSTRPGEPLTSMHEGVPPSQSPVERPESGSVNKRKIDRKRGVPYDDARSPSSSVPAKRVYDDDGPRQSWEDRRRTGPGQSGPAQYNNPPHSPSYERTDPPLRPIDTGNDQRPAYSGRPPSPPYPHSPPGNYSSTSFNSRNRPPTDTYRPPPSPEYNARRIIDHYSPARPLRDLSPPPQRRLSRAGDSYRPPPEPASQRYEGQPRRSPPPRQASPQPRSLQRNDNRSQQPALQARISSMNGDDRPGPVSSESRHLSLEERMQTVPATTEPVHSSRSGDMLSRIGVDQRPHDSYTNTDDVGEPKRPARRARGGVNHKSNGGAGPARGRGGGATGTNGRGRGKNVGPGGHRRDMSSDGSSGPGLLGRMSGP